MALAVIRRVGGLEGGSMSRTPSSIVIRRVGGLEAQGSPVKSLFVVIRRVGGLEVTKHVQYIQYFRYPPCRWFRR